MSSGLGEWEKGIPCMLHGSLSWGGRLCGGQALWGPSGQPQQRC